MYDFYTEISRLKKARVDKFLSAEQVSAALGKSPEFFTEFCENEELFEMTDYLSICRVLGVQPSSRMTN